MCRFLGHLALGAALGATRELRYALELESKWTRPAEPSESSALRLNALEERLRLLKLRFGLAEDGMGPVPCLGCRAAVPESEMRRFLQTSELRAEQLSTMGGCA